MKVRIKVKPTESKFWGQHAEAASPLLATSGPPGAPRISVHPTKKGYSLMVADTMSSFHLCTRGKEPNISPYSSSYSALIRIYTYEESKK